MASSLLAFSNAVQLLVPHLWVGVAQAVVGQGANACQRCAQLVRHIARELALRLHAKGNATQQRIDGLAQALHIVGGGGHGHRCEVAHVTLTHCRF